MRRMADEPRIREFLARLGASARSPGASSAAPDPTGAPGAELVVPGLRDLHAGRVTTEALVVAVGASRLRALGFDVPPTEAGPEHRLYRHLVEREGDNAHSAYNALVRRLVSFERAMDGRRVA